MEKKVTILLATYKGEEYIERQLESLFNQTYTNWELLIRDDCSPDRTLEIVSKYSIADKRITIVDNQNLRQGACQNFASLMNFCAEKSQYIMFCDQDDIWLPSKIQTTLESMQLLEEKHGSDKNLMVYGTYKRIDEKDNDLNLPTPDYSILPKLNMLLVQNYVYGCTIMVNKKLLNATLPVSKMAENHDYWITLSAIVNNSYFKYIPEPQMLYRQHTNNVTGSYKNAHFINRLKRFINNKEVESIKSKQKMFESLYESYKDIMNIEQKNMLQKFIEKTEKGGIPTLLFCLKNNIVKLGKPQTILFYINLLRFNK